MPHVLLPLRSSNRGRVTSRATIPEVHLVVLGLAVQTQLLAERIPFPSLRSQGGLPSGGEAGATSQGSGRGSPGIGSKGYKRASEQRQDRWAVSIHRTLSGWAAVAQGGLCQAVRFKAELEGAGPSHKGLRSHTHGDEHRLTKSYKRAL